MAQTVLSPRSWETNKAPGYISWLNALLNQRSLVVNDLSRDLRDGVILLNLIEIITGRNVDSLGLKFKKSPVRYGDQPFPKSHDEQLENVRSAFKCLEHFNIKTAGCEPEDIVDGNAQLMTALIFSFKKYAKDHSVNIIAGPTNSSDTSISTSVTDTTTKLSKSGATTLNNSTVIAIKNNDKELERSYRGGSGSAQNSLANLPNTTRSRSGNKKSSKDKDKDHGVKDKEKNKHKDLDDLSKLSPEEKAKKTNPIRIDQIHRANNKLPTPNLDLIGEIRDQLDETQRDLEFTESPSKHIWELNKLIHKAKEMEKELLQGERKRIQLTPVQSHGANPSSPRLLDSPTSLRPIVDATGFDAVHEKVALQLNEATINNLMAKMKQQKTTRNSTKNVNLEENMKKFRSNSIIQQKYNFARKKQLKFQRRSRTEYPLKEGRDDDNNRSTLFKVKVSQPGKSSKDNDTKTETTKIVPTNTNTTTTKPVETATQKVSAATAENRQKVIEKLRRKSRAGLKKSKTTTEDKPAARVLRKSSSMKVIKPTVIMPLTDDVLEVSETAASKEEGDLRNRASDHNSDAGSDAEGSDSSSSESEVSRLEFGDRHIRRTGSLGSTTSTGSAIKPASHNNGSVTHSPVVSRAASSPQGLLVANAKGILNAAAPPLPIPAPKKSRPRSGAMVPVIPEKEETQGEPAQLSPTSPTPITTSVPTPTPELANQEPIKAITPPPGTTKVVAPIAKNPGGVKIGSAKGQPPKAGFKPGTAPSKTGVKQGPPPKAGTKQAAVGPKKVLVEEHQPVTSNDSNSTTTMPSAFQRVIAATSPKRQTTSGETSSPVLSRVASFNAAANQGAVTKPRPESPVRRIETEVSVASLVDSFTSNSSKNSSPEPTRQKSSRDMLSPMRLSVRTGELDRVVSRTNSFNEISESQSLESSVSFVKDEHEAPQRSNSNNSTNPSSGNTTPHKDEQAVQSTVAPTAVNQPETKTNEAVESKQEDKSVETVTVDKVTQPEDHIAKEEQVPESPKSEEKKELALTKLEDHIVRDEHILNNLNNTEKTNQTDEPKKISLSIKSSVSPTTDRANDKSPGRTQYSKSVSVAKIGKASVNNNNGEKPQLQRKKSKTTDDIVANKPTVEEIEEANHLATSGENGTDSENSPSTPRRKRSFSDMSNIVVSNTKQKDLEETNEEHAKKAQIQRQQSKNFLKSFYKSLKHSFSSTSKRNLVANPAKEGTNTNNEETKEPKKSDEHDHDDKAHKKDKKETKKMNKQASLGNVKDKDKIKSSKPNKSATSPNIQSNNNTNKK